jgi:hypothetical protein
MCLLKRHKVDERIKEVYTRGTLITGNGEEHITDNNSSELCK